MLCRWLDYRSLGWKTQGWKSCYWLQDGRRPKTKDFHPRWPPSLQMLGSRPYPIPPRRYCHPWLPILLCLRWCLHLATSWRWTNPTPFWHRLRDRGSWMWQNSIIRSTITTASYHHHAIWPMHVAPLGRITEFKRWLSSLNLYPSKPSRYLRIDQTRETS